MPCRVHGLIGRVLPFALFFSLVVPALANAASQNAAAVIEGVVTDPSGAPLVRVHIRLLDSGGKDIASTLTDRAGRFTFPACASCRVEASLGGFVTQSAPAGRAVTLALTLAPVHEQVVVSATRDAAPTSQIGASVTVFSREDIERRGAPTLAELVRATPGVTVVRTGGLGNVTSLLVRGGESNYNKVLIDGIPINEPGGTFNFANLTTAHLERVEILRGAHSALFGSDAMASVVQLVGRRARGGPRPTGSLDVQAGAYGTTRFSGDVGDARGRWDYTIGLSRFETDNRAPNNHFTNTTLALGGGIAFGDRAELRFVGRVEQGRAGSPGATAFGRADLDAFGEKRDVTGGATLLHQVTRRWRQRMTYALTTTRQESTNLVLDAPYIPAYQGRTAPFTFFDFAYDSDNRLRRHHAAYQLDGRFEAPARLGSAQFLTASVEWDGERATLTNRLSGLAVPASRDNAGVTLQHQLVGRRASLTTGIRFEHNASFGHAVVPRLSAVYFARESGGAFGATKIKGNVGLGIKEPTILQSFSPSLGFLGNPDLEAERSESYDVGIEQRLADDHVKLEIVWFEGEFRNQISTRTISFSPFTAQYFNIGKTRALGTETSVDIAAGSLRLRAGHTFLNSRIVASTSSFSPAFSVGQWTFRRPRHSGYVGASWTWRRASLDINGVFTGRRVDSDFSALEPPMLESPAHAVWSAGASAQVHERVSVYGRIENLTDKVYMEPLGFPAWGRTGHAGLRVKF